MHPDDSRPATPAPTPSPAARWAPSTWSVVAILAALAALCCTPLLAPGWFASHEDLGPLARALATWDEIADGDPYPRWLADAYAGKGVPLFNFYPPAFSLLVAYARALGIPILVGAKAVVLLLFFLGALGTWLWTRRHLGAGAALVAAVLYLYAPYHFVDLYVRAAMAEFTALAALPFLLLGVDLLVERWSARGVAALASASAAVVVSHFLGALMIAPFTAVYAAARAPGRGGWAALGRVAAGAAVGAGLSAFYWLPALAEGGALSAERGRALVSGYYSVFLHFVEPAQWLDPRWGFGGSVPGPDDQMSFQVGLLVAAAIVASAFSARWLPAPARGFVVLALSLAAAALWLTTEASAPLYERIGTLRLVQFPWRFLGPATLFLAAGGAGVARVAAERRAWLGPAVAAAAVALAVLLSAPQRAIARPLPVGSDEEIAAAAATIPWSIRYGQVDPLLPRDADPEVASVRPGGPRPEGAGVEIGDLVAGRKDVTFELTAAPGGAVVVVPWHAFPGWEVRLDGAPWPLVPGPDGLVAFAVPEGVHVATVRFGTTRVRIAGWLLAVVAVTVLGAVAVREWALRRWAPGR